MFRNVILRACNRVARLTNLRYFSNEMGETTNIEKCVNKVTLLGRVGADPQKRGNSENPVVTFPLATHTNYKYESGEFMQRTDWHKICIFNPTLKNTVYKFLKKGQRTMILGRITYSEYKGADGNVMYSTSIIAEEIVFFQ